MVLIIILGLLLLTFLLLPVCFFVDFVICDCKMSLLKVRLLSNRFDYISDYAKHANKCTLVENFPLRDTHNLQSRNDQSQNALFQ